MGLATSKVKRVVSKGSLKRPVGKEGGSAEKEAKRPTRRERNELVVGYRQKARKLARSILRRWNARLDIGEVDSIVDLSLCEAVQRFRPDKGASFMTFMFFHLRGNLIRAVAGSVTAYSLLGADVEDAIDDGATPGRTVNAAEVARALFNSDHSAPDEELFRKELATISAGAFDRLDPLEREVINRIYLAEEQLLDIADTLGYSRCHISRVKKRALETLFHELRNSLGDELARIVPTATEGVPEEPFQPREIRRRRPRSGKTVRGSEDQAVAA